VAESPLELPARDHDIPQNSNCLAADHETPQNLNCLSADEHSPDREIHQNSKCLATDEQCPVKPLVSKLKRPDRPRVAEQRTARRVHFFIEETGLVVDDEVIE